MNSQPDPGHTGNFGLAWLFLCVAFCAHVADETLTGFLDVYNPTVLAVRAQHPWFTMPTFKFQEWLIGLILANAVFLVLTPLAYRKVRWLRPLAYFYACIMLLNGLGHTVATIFGRTVSTVHFRRPAPGFYSSPLLFTASIYLLFCLTRTRQKKRATDF